MNNEDILARIKINILERLKTLMLCDRNEPWADGGWRETAYLGRKECLEQFGTEYSQKLHLGLDRLTVQSHQARLKRRPFTPTWSWHLHCLHWGQDFRLWFSDFAYCGGKGRRGRRIWNMKLSDLEQINTNCWVYFREGKMVSSALYHQTCPGFLVCVPCSFFV